MTIKTSDLVGGGGSVYPTVTGDATYSGNGVSGNLVEDQEGFTGDGDYVRLPTTAAGSLDYFNNAGVSQSGWPITIANVDGTSTKWLGFMFDAADSLLYVATSSSTTRVVLSSINSAGTIVTLGAVTITAFATQPDWGTGGPSNNGSCNLYRDADGSGNFTVRALVTGNLMQEVVITSAGALDTDTTTVFNPVASGGGAHYKTPNGAYIGTFAPSDTANNNVLCMIGTGTANNTKATSLILPQGSGVFSTKGTGGYPMQWKGRITLVHYNATLYSGPKYVLAADFNSWVDDLAAAAGV